METQIAILRGINVGGKRKILMADLRAMFERLDFSNVSTYIQSGNVFFTSAMDNKQAEDVIEKSIQQEFGFDVPVIVRSHSELHQAINDNPFYHTEADITKLHLTFLKEPPTEENIREIAAYDFSPDKFSLKEKNVFIYCEGKYHKSKLSNTFFEKKLRVNATTRNWKTVLRLIELNTISNSKNKG